ncbi:MAG: hypothetical protein IKR15_02415 [Bacteroidales bacterium]|nr:hypothetical protein [Bacteroidales bacterium]
MKKSFLFLMLAAMVAFVLACTPTEQPKPDSSKDATETPSQEPSANPSDEPSDEPSVNPTESEDPSVEPEDPSVEPEDPSVEPEGISIDGDPSDWDALDPEYVTSIVHAEAEGIGLKSGKVFYDDKVYVLLEVSDEALAKGVADGKLRFHIFFNSDYSYGGGYNSHWKELNINYATEGKMTSGGAYCDYSSKLYAIAPGTSWTTSDSGYSPVFSAAGDGNYYELSMDYTDFPGGLTTTFGIGFDIADGGYTTIDYLPNDGEASHLATVVKYGTEPLEAPGPITIDGDMSDWADIEGAVLTPTGDEGAEGALALEEIKACADANNVYVYVKRSKRHGRWTDLFKGSSNSGYYYYDFDLDNNPETGDKAEHSNGNYEAWCYIYHFYGSSTEPTVKESDMKGGFEGMTSAGIVSKGAFTEDSIEVETAFPRSCLPEFSSESFAVSVWGNKDANPFTKTEGIVY